MTIIGKFHSGDNHKDGYCRISDCNIIHINDFLISVTPEIAKKFDGKKVKVTGVYHIIEGTRNKPQYGKNGEKIVYQGREEDAFLFNSPTIEILE